MPNAVDELTLFADGKPDPQERVRYVERLDGLVTQTGYAPEAAYVAGLARYLLWKAPRPADVTVMGLISLAKVPDRDPYYSWASLHKIYLLFDASEFLATIAACSGLRREAFKDEQQWRTISVDEIEFAARAHVGLLGLALPALANRIVDALADDRRQFPLFPFEPWLLNRELASAIERGVVSDTSAGRLIREVKLSLNKSE